MNPRQIASVLLVSAVLSVTAVRADEESPFKGTWEGQTVAADFSAFPPIVGVVASGTGEATQLGRFTRVSPHSNNVFTLEVEGVQNFTAANGDTLTADFTGQGMPTERQDAIIGSDESLSQRFECNQSSFAANAGIDDHDMD